ncbi:hypothetical protein [Sphingobium yanoikuyae]|jgi:hypothetical protein|uniref:hypothetical protein n=1 Tax=Sphingobium yanoikuyae TaxID=13690 RepID=UPI001929A791|nr:hypothetical protein [Sphingobium yanoikuyae]
MTTADNVNYLLRRARQEARTAREAMARGDHMMMIYAHRELAVRYAAKASVLQRGLILV